MKKVLGRVALAGVGLALALGLFEGVLQLLTPGLAGTFRGFYETSPEVGYKMKPGLDLVYSNPEYRTEIRSNSLGFRDDEHSLVKPEGTIRILVLGDSFVESLQVDLEETFHQILEQRLNETSGGAKFEVIAMGVGGFGLSNEYLTWEHFGRDFNPDWVLLVAGSMNDIGCVGLDYPVDVEQLEERVVTTTNALKGSRTGRLYRSFRTYTILRNQLWRLPGGYSVFTGLRSALFKVLNQEDAQATEPNPWLIYAASGELSPATRQCWEQGYEFIAEFERSVRAQGGELLVVMRPRVEQLVESRLQREFDFWDLEPEASQVDPDRADNFAEETLATLGVASLVLYPYMRRATDDSKILHFKVDRHWTKAGHQVAAEAILEKFTGLAK